MRHGLIHSALLALATVAPAFAGTPATAPSVDDSLFRDGLRERGLTDWLEQYLAETPPTDAADARLREREQLLQQAAAAPAGAQQRRLIEQGSAILIDLLDKYPSHPGRLRWELELARDYLERTDPAAFNAVFLYEIPGANQRRAFDLSGRAVRILTQLREEIAAAWKSVESLDESSLQAATASGSLRLLETLDGRSAYLLTWATFCRSISTNPPPGDRSARMRAMLTEVTQGSGWVQSPDPFQRCGAMVMAAISARLAGEFDQADQYSLQIVNLYQGTTSMDDRARLRTASLVAVIEQIRTLRDRKRWEDALSFVEQTQRWAEKSRPNDIQAALAIAWVHHIVLAVRQSPASRPVGILQPEDALEPLEQFARRSPQHRDALYTMLNDAVEDESVSSTRTPFGVQLLLGATVIGSADAAASRPAASRPGDRRRLEDVILTARAMLGTLPADVVPEARGELLYLLGLAHLAAGRPLEAIALLCDLAEQQPGHDRSARAAACAVAVAQQLLHDSQNKSLRTTRDAFIRAGRLLCKLSPQTPVARALPYHIAAALEQNGQLDEAAETYATVAADDEQWLAARVGRARCLSGALVRAVAGKSMSEEQVRKLADRAIESAREAAAAAQQQRGGSARQRHLPAETVVLLAGLLNHPIINKSPESLMLLQDFEQRFPDQPGMMGEVWRERISALTHLGRFAEARQAAQRCLEAGPEAAGPALDQLLKAMRGAIDSALDRNDGDAAIKLAREAAVVGGLLVEWAERHPQRVSPGGRLTLRLWRAEALLQARQADEALAAYEECRKTAASLPADSVPHVEINLGRAEGLLATSDAAAAMPLFVEAWRSLPERSSNWWRAFCGSLACHTRLEHDPKEILQAILQQQTLAPDLGGPRWQQSLEAIRKENESRLQRSPSAGNP